MVINAGTSLSSTTKSRSHYIRSVYLLGAGMFLIPTIIFPKHSNAFSISSTIFSHPARALSQIVLDSNSSFSASSSPSFMSVPGFYLPPRISTPCWISWTLCLPAPFQMQPPDVIHPDNQTNQVHNIANTLTPARLMVIDNIGRNG
jgi:hypothetical protein